MSAMVCMRGLQPRDLMPVGGVAVTRDTVNHWLLDSMCCDGYHVPRAYNCLQPLCVPAAFPRQLIAGVCVLCTSPHVSPPPSPHIPRSIGTRQHLRLHCACQLRQRFNVMDTIVWLAVEWARDERCLQCTLEARWHDEG